MPRLVHGLELLVVTLVATAAHLIYTLFNLSHPRVLNVSLHAATAAAFCLFLHHLTSRLSFTPPPSSSSSSALLPSFAAATFAIHPIHTESVIAADHAGILAGFLFVCSMLMYSSSSLSWGGEAVVPGQARSFFLRFLSLVVGLLSSIITHEAGLLALPLVLASLDLCVRRSIELRRQAPLFLLLLLVLLMPLVSPLVGDWTASVCAVAATSFGRLTPLSHWLTRGLRWLYLTASSALLLVLPDAHRLLGLHNKDPPISSLVDARHIVTAGLFSAFGLTWLFGWWRMSRECGGASPGWGLLMLGLTWLVVSLLFSNPSAASVSASCAAYTNTSTVVAERALYIPSLGFSLLVGLLLARLYVSRPRFCMALALLLFAGCSVNTISRLNTFALVNTSCPSTHPLHDRGHNTGELHHPPPSRLDEGNEPSEIRTLMMLVKNQKEMDRSNGEDEEIKIQALKHSARTLLKHPNLPQVHALAREIIVHYLPELATHWQGTELPGIPSLARVVIGVGEHLLISDLVSTAMTIDPSVSGPFYVRQLHRAIELAAQGRPPVPTSWSAPRGIVISAGGVRYLTVAYINLHMLRETGCQLPVEIWYNGAREMPLQAKSLFSGISNLRFVDASQFVPSPNQQEEQEGTGYRMKAFAVAHSSFREVMLLDADNTPIRDPAFLFEEPAYTQSGAIFWPDDCGVQSLSRELWTLLDLHPPATEAEFPTAPYAKKSGCKDKRYDNEFEAGQLIIDKGRHWAAVQGSHTRLRCTPILSLICFPMYALFRRRVVHEHKL